MLSLRHFGLVLFIPWRVGAEESGAAKNGLRAQHLNNALTECLKWGRVNLLCHGRARASFSLTLGAGAMLLERIGRLGGAAAAGGGRDALSYGVSFATTRSHQLARGAPACFLSGISGWFSLSLGAWVPKNLARRKTKNKAIANQSPLLKLSRVPIPKNVYASAIGLCKDSIIMQSRKPSNSDF